MSEGGDGPAPPVPAAALHDDRPPVGDRLSRRGRRRRRRRRERRYRWGSLALYAALATLLFRSAWSAPAVRNVGWGGDSQLFAWFLQWAPFSVFGGHNPLVTDHVNHPIGLNLMWNTAVLPVGLVLAPVTHRWGPIASFNVAMTAGMALSAWTAYLLVRRFVVHPPAAVVAGLVYGFSPFTAAHALGHVNWVMAFVPPLVALLLDELLVRQRHRPAAVGAALGALAALQLMISSELLAITALAAALVVLLLAVTAPRRAARNLGHAAGGVAVGLCVFLALAAAPLATQLFGPHRPHGPLQREHVFATDVANLVVPSPLLQLSPPSAEAVTEEFTGNVAETNGYLGVPLLALVLVVTVAGRRRPLVRLVAATALGLTVLSLGTRLHYRGEVHHDVPLPFSLVQRLPLLDHLLPNRIMVLVFLCAAILVGVALDWGLSRRGARRAAVLASVGVVLASLLPVVNYPSTETVRSKFFLDGAKALRPGSVALVIPVSSSRTGVEAMAWQADARMRFKMPGGYFAATVGSQPYGSPMPRTLVVLFTFQLGAPPPPPGSPLYAEMRAELARWRVEAVVVGPMTHHLRAARLVTAITGRRPQPVDDVLVWRLSDRRPAAGAARATARPAPPQPRR